MLRQRDPQQFIPCFVRDLLIISSFALINVIADTMGTAQRPGEHGNSVHNIGLGPGAKDMDMATWSALKNSEVGPAISPRLTESGAWRPDPQPKLVADPIPGLSAGVPGMVVHDCLSDLECKELIKGYPIEGKGYMAGERVAELYRDRKVKSRILAHDEELASVLRLRLQEHLPQELDGGKLYRVNPNFRFLHYESGGHHSTHIDGREPGVPRWDEEAGGWVQSRLTMQVYLNSHGKDFTGGEFAVVDAEGNSTHEAHVKHLVKPSAGDVVLFYQERLDPPSLQPPYELQHQGNDVIEGEKFACRTMVDYVFATKERAQMGNIKDDAANLSCTRQGISATVLAIGNTIIDTMLNVPHLPVDEKMIVASKKKYVGGQGANAAQAMALLGMNVSFMTRLGDDADGSLALRAYQGLGMDVSPTLQVPGATTSSATVVVTTGKEKHRSCLIHDDEALIASMDPSDILEATLTRVRQGEFGVVYTDGWQTDLAVPVARVAAEHSVLLVVDMEMLDANTRILFELANIAIVPVEIAKALAEVPDVKAAVLALANQQEGKVVIATVGEEGSYGAHSGDAEVVHVPALDIDVKDTTGAGDAYHAGFLASMARSTTLKERMDFATRVAAAKCATPGSALTREALERSGLVHADCPAKP